MEAKNDYLDLLTCAICYTHMSNTICVKLCIMGHSVCCECYNHLTTCPYCRSPWSKTRNRNLEQLISLASKTYKSKDLIDNENLKCPRCHSLMEGNIILCGDGHSICKGCVQDIYQCVLCPKLICYKRNFSLEKFIDSVKTMHKASSNVAKVKVKVSNLIHPCCAEIIDKPKLLYHHIMQQANHRRVFFKYNQYFRLLLRSPDNVTYFFLKPLKHDNMFFIRLTYCNFAKTKLYVQVLELSESKKFDVVFKSAYGKKLLKLSEESQVNCDVDRRFIQCLYEPASAVRSVYLRIKLLDEVDKGSFGH